MRAALCWPVKRPVNGPFVDEPAIGGQTRGENAEELVLFEESPGRFFGGILAMISHVQRIGAALLCLLPAVAWGQGIQLKTPGEVIHGPAEGEDSAAWLRAMQQWRQKRRAEIRYDGSQYDRSQLAWAQRSFIQPQVMVEERFLYDPVTGKYTVDRYLDDLDSRYGGIDSVLVWPVYPNIGIDNRNQHDLLHDMPGGLPGLR